MWWEDFTWKVRGFLSKRNLIPIGILTAVAVYISAPFLAPLLHWPRGDLLALALEWMTGLVLEGMFAGVCGPGLPQSGHLA